MRSLRAHVGRAPRYRRCPACNRFEWWQPFRETRAARRDRERNEAHEAARPAGRDGARPGVGPATVTTRLPRGGHAQWRHRRPSWVNLDTGEQGSTTHAWAGLFNGALAEAEPMEAQMLRDWLALGRGARGAGRPRPGGPGRERPAAGRVAGRAGPHRRERGRYGGRGRAPRRPAGRGRAARPGVATCALVSAPWRAPLRSLAPGAGCAAVALLAAGLLWSLDVRAWPAHVQAWMDAPDAPEATHGAPAMFREEDYLVAHREAQEMVADWDAKIEARIERDRALPGDIDLAGARAQRAFWADRAATMSEHLEQYR